MFFEPSSGVPKGREMGVDEFDFGVFGSAQKGEFDGHGDTFKDLGGRNELCCGNELINGIGDDSD
jgi:hypothetical protein